MAKKACHAFASTTRFGLTQALGAMRDLSAIDGMSVVSPLWEVGCAHGVLREDLRSHLGQPAYIETDSTRTFGGEEDWWFYATSAGANVLVCLRVPYMDAVLFVTDLSRTVVAQAMSALGPWPVEMYPEPYPQR